MSELAIDVFFVWYLTAVTETLHEKCKCAKTRCRRTKNYAFVISCGFFSSTNFSCRCFESIVCCVCVFFNSLYFFIPSTHTRSLMIQFRSSQIFEIEWFQFKWKIERQQNILHKNKEINKKYFVALKIEYIYKICHTWTAGFSFFPFFFRFFFFFSFFPPSFFFC